MTQSRRDFLAGAVITAALGGTTLGCAASSSSPEQSPLAAEIITMFEPLPGLKAMKIWAPKTERAPEFLASLNPRLPLFCGSAFKAFVLCEALRQSDAPDVTRQLATTQLALNDTVWTVSSPVFNTPNLAGQVSERTTLEAMISHSDNTGTDMALKLVGADKVRNFIANIGLKDSLIPDTTRAFFGYIFGAPNWRTLTWEELLSLLATDQPLAHPVINDVQTMVSTPDDFVSFYARALQGQFFTHAETLREFRAILSLANAIPHVVPLGVSAFMKGGSIDANPSHALCLAGGLFVPDRWVYCAIMLNWDKPVDIDPETVQAFMTAVQQAFTMLKAHLST